MKAVSISPFKAVDKAYYKNKPNRIEFNNLKTQLNKFTENIREKIQTKILTQKKIIICSSEKDRMVISFMN